MPWDRIVAFLRRLISPMPSAQFTITLVAAVLVTLALIAKRRGWLHGPRGWLWTGLGLSVGGIIIATLAFRIGDQPPAGTGREVILAPFKGLWHAAGPHATPDASANFYGNIALYVPLGVVTVWLLHSQLVKRVALAWLLAAALSTSIELTQSTMNRVADINDVILNSSGAALGACLGGAVLIAMRRTKGGAPAQQSTSLV
ncbi:VanZ family protein [Demequina lutea]|uniref:VanZ family protein n=1 Tax=Demequina lutea TaxID=431489 RepID=A0A7Y9ZAC2_9MICO|nr:VanZ family protein [Demequina lutea]NYI40435.1 VanZ family protein [Demequina lutea]